MSARDDASRLRTRDDAISDELSVSPYATDPGPACLVAQTTQLVAYPSAAMAWYACAPVAVLGAEVEGGPASFSTVGSTFFALNLGTAVPPKGANVVVTFVGNRWVFRFDG